MNVYSDCVITYVNNASGMHVCADLDYACVYSMYMHASYAYVCLKRMHVFMLIRNVCFIRMYLYVSSYLYMHVFLVFVCTFNTLL